MDCQRQPWCWNLLCSVFWTSLDFFFLSFFFFFFKLYFCTKMHTHTLTCALFFITGWMDEGTDSRTDSRTVGRREDSALRTTTRENVTLLWFWFVFCIFWGGLSMNNAASFGGLAGGRNTWFWVLKQEINVSMLYPMNWKLLNLCMESTAKCFWWLKSKKKNYTWVQFW